MSLYETIFLRRSVRKYHGARLGAEELAEIAAFIEETKQLDLDENLKARFEIVPPEKVKGKFNAPHYIVANCAADDFAYMNVGYVLQNVDLFLQGRGLGSLWLGMGKQDEPDEDYCIMLAFGKTDVPPRSGAGDFKRHLVEKVSNEDNSIAQAARLAPSAVNSQPWKLEFSGGKVVVRYNGRGILKPFLKKKLSKIDLGIIARHVEICLSHEGKTVQKITPFKNGKDFGIEIYTKG